MDRPQRTILLTGANSGIGYETARQLAARGERVVLACRSMAKANETALRIRAEHPEAALLPLEMDLSRQESVRDAVEGLDLALDVLICNAGLSYSGAKQVTAEGVELTFGVNHLGHFLLATLLLSKHPSTLERVLVVASNVHNPEMANGPFPKPDFNSLREIAFPEDLPGKAAKQAGSLRYVHSKLCNVLFSYELARRFSDRGLLVNAFNPGFVPRTNLKRDSSAFTRFFLDWIMPLFRGFMKAQRTVEEAAADLIYVCLDQGEGGKYFDGREAVKSSPQSYDLVLAEELWSLSEELCGGEENGLG